MDRWIFKSKLPEIIVFLIEAHETVLVWAYIRRDIYSRRMGWVYIQMGLYLGGFIV